MIIMRNKKVKRSEEFEVHKSLLNNCKTWDQDQESFVWLQYEEDPGIKQMPGPGTALGG